MDRILATTQLTKEFKGFVAVSKVNLRQTQEHSRSDRAERRGQDYLLQSAREVSDSVDASACEWDSWHPIVDCGVSYDDPLAETELADGRVNISCTAIRPSSFL